MKVFMEILSESWHHTYAFSSKSASQITGLQSTCNPAQNNSEKVKKSRKIGQDQQI